MKNKKFLIIFVFICCILFFIFYYIFCNSGNNKNISQEKIVEEILNRFDNYEANIEVTVMSNKNENKYEMRQIVNKNYSKQEVLSPENVKNMIIELEGNKLKISNFNMEKIYEEYNTVLNNSLFLNTFSNDYFNNNSEIYTEDGKIVVEIKLLNNSNTYIKYKLLYLNSQNYEPEKLIVKDITKKPYINIIYNDIKIK